MQYCITCKNKLYQVEKESMSAWKLFYLAEHGYSGDLVCKSCLQIKNIIDEKTE